jgi:hypothetical protein
MVGLHCRINIDKGLGSVWIAASNCQTNILVLTPDAGIRLV